MWVANLCCKGMLLEDLVIDEQIDKYQKCLDPDDKDWTQKEEEMLNSYGIKTMVGDTLEIISNTKMTKMMHL